MNFAEKVKAERTKLGLTQEGLAERMGVTKRVIYTYENDKAKPRTTKNYERLATALEVDVDYLLGNSGCFVLSSEQQFGYRGKKGAEILMNEIAGLFAGGEMEEEDMDTLMFAVQEAYVIAKKNNREKYGKKAKKR